MRDTVSGSAILIHKEHICLSPRGIFWNQSTLCFSNTTIARKINLHSIDLIELRYLEKSNDFLGEEGRWMTLRQALQFVNPEDFHWVSKALSILRWDKYHQFCGGCSKKTLVSHGIFERYCSDCEIKYYPRISPAIIVLIQRNDEILMARSPHFPQGVYGLIAGFVEAGESLEEAVHREVFEEVGIQIKNLSYYGSQPWPFPDSLMVGFFAEYASGDLSVDKAELEEANWYLYHELPGLPSSKISIASKMIEKFLSLKRTKAK